MQALLAASESNTQPSNPSVKRLASLSGSLRRHLIGAEYSAAIAGHHSHSAPAAAAPQHAAPSPAAAAEELLLEDPTSGHSRHWKRGMGDVKVSLGGSGDSFLWRVAAHS